MNEADAPHEGGVKESPRDHTGRLTEAIDSLSVPLAYDVQLEAAAHVTAGPDQDLYESLVAELKRRRYDAPAVTVPDPRPDYTELQMRLARWRLSAGLRRHHAEYLIDVHRHNATLQRKWFDEADEIRRYTASVPDPSTEDLRIGREAERILRRRDQLEVEGKLVWNDWHQDWERPKPTPVTGRRREPLTAEQLLTRFDRVRQVGGGWTARCPGHEDGTPSLSIRRGDKWWLLHCFAGCTTQAICDAVGLTVSDLHLGGDDE